MTATPSPERSDVTDAVPVPRASPAPAPTSIEPSTATPTPRLTTGPAPARTRRGPGALAGHLLRQYSLVALLMASLVFYGTWSQTATVFEESSRE